MSDRELIFIIDDDEKLSGLLKDYLERFGFSVLSASHPIDGLNQINQLAPSLVILDIMLPEIDGFEVLKRIRKQSDLPVIMLTARGDFTDRVVGLEIGADDYMPKPFEPRELVARIQSVLRRSNQNTTKNILEFGQLTINFSSHEVQIGDLPLELTSTEYELLALFVHNQGKVLTRDEILDQVRGIEWESFNRSVDVLVSRLRQKLNDDPKHPKYLKTVWGSGYLFLAPQKEQA
ncbi:MAG: response regulator transcription factor [Deltaproteobacteria bacterium]|nr:response regulator transcription factor [Deltaproteobacteria bacterium]